VKELLEAYVIEKLNLQATIQKLQQVISALIADSGAAPDTTWDFGEDELVETSPIQISYTKEGVTIERAENS